MNNITRNTLLAVSLLVVGTATLLHPSTKLTTDRNVTKSLVSKTVTESPAQSKEYKITNLQLDPKQTIIFNAEVGSDAVDLTIAQINELSKNGKDIYLVLNSPGGSVFAGAKLIAYMEGARVNVNTVCYELCASMAAQITEHGAKRLMISSATLMFHQAAGGVEGSLKEMKNRLGYIDIVITKLDAYIANRSGINREEFDRMVEHELWIDGQDSLDKNLVDGLVTIAFNGSSGQPFVISQQLKNHNIVPQKTITLENPLKNIK